jgi:hypothetical protein
VTRALLVTLALTLPGAAWADGACVAETGDPLGFEPAPIEAGRRVLHVGPGRKLATPAAAARAARDGDAILIDAAEYPGSRAVWPQSRLLIRGVNGRPHLVGGEKLAQGKAIWVFNGDEVVVENVEFSGARLASGNGAGIRAQGRRLTVRAGYFHDSDTGLLSDNDPEQQITIEYSEFARNGHEDGKAHNLYIGSIGRFEMRFSSSHGARAGHLVKSRAKQNLIAYNRLADLPAGPASYELDFPRSTDATVIGNLILQAQASPNGTILSYGAEDKGRAPEGRLRIASNTFVSLRSRPIFVFNHSPEPALIVANVFGGAAGQDVRGPADSRGNLIAPLSDFADSAALDFRLGRPAASSRGTVPLIGSRPPDLVPEFEYVHPSAARVRTNAGRDLPGAFGSCGGSAS